MYTTLCLHTHTHTHRHTHAHAHAHTRWPHTRLQIYCIIKKEPYHCTKHLRSVQGTVGVWWFMILCRLCVQNFCVVELSMFLSLFVWLFPKWCRNWNRITTLRHYFFKFKKIRKQPCRGWSTTFWYSWKCQVAISSNFGGLSISRHNTHKKCNAILSVG